MKTVRVLVPDALKAALDRWAHLDIIGVVFVGSEGRVQRAVFQPVPMWTGALLDLVWTPGQLKGANAGCWTDLIAHLLYDRLLNSVGFAEELEGPRGTDLTDS